MDADVIVIGAGAFGLWSAWECLGRGMDVLVVERDRPGAGASGGVVGVLAPHAPDRWSPAKAFQRDALRALGPALAAVEAAGGGRSGYGRVGRVQPLAGEAERARAEALAAEAATHWPGATALLPPDALPGWIDPGAAAGGILRDGVSARLDPAATCAALARAVVARGGRIVTAEATGVAPGAVRTAARTLRAGAVVVAAGVRSFPLTGMAGGGVKGQAALLDARPGPMPSIQARGLYVVAHDHAVAVGSTSEKAWDDPLSTDAGLDAVIGAARALCPALRDAPVIRRWAGLRPRAADARPVIGPVPAAPGIWACTGGYKIGFGIGQAAGAAVAAMIAGAAPALPPTFLPRACPGLDTPPAPGSRVPARGGPA